MNYSLNLVTTIADCDALLNMANDEKNTLEYRQTTLNYQLNNQTESSVEFASDLLAATTELQSVEASIAQMTEGDARNAQIRRKMTLELKIFNMNLRAENYGITSVLSRQMEINQVAQQLEVTDAFIADVEARKLQLAA
ncbi:MAG: hypothetical protein RLZZ262_2437 [Bacteroidota bacterium]|jgi:hypothetical protein